MAARVSFLTDSSRYKVELQPLFCMVYCPFPNYPVGHW